MRRRRGGDAFKFFECTGDLVLEPAEARQHFGNALAREILKVAGLEDLKHAIPDILREPLLEVVLERGRQVVRRLIDVFGGR